MFCHNTAFLYCLTKKCRQSRLKKCRYDSRLRPTKNRLRLHPKSGGSATLVVMIYLFMSYSNCIVIRMAEIDFMFKIMRILLYNFNVNMILAVDQFCGCGSVSIIRIRIRDWAGAGFRIKWNKKRSTGLVPQKKFCNNCYVNGMLA